MESLAVALLFIHLSDQESGILEGRRCGRILLGLRKGDCSTVQKYRISLNFIILSHKLPFFFFFFFFFTFFLFLFFCRSCRVAPLIQCDYCPLLFHMDCLEPPLTAMPLGRWMCPNHIEHVVVSTAAFSQSTIGTDGLWTNSIESILRLALCQCSL
jgi:hypothetical protein